MAISQLQVCDSCGIIREDIVDVLPQVSLCKHCVTQAIEVIRNIKTELSCRFDSSTAE
jgi:hypothetical protein